MIVLMLLAIVVVVDVIYLQLLPNIIYLSVNMEVIKAMSIIANI